MYITSRKASACDAAVKALNALPNLAPGAKAIAVPADSAKFEGGRILGERGRENNRPCGYLVRQCWCYMGGSVRYTP